jgi:polyisoprenoid-binding protein YceI
VKYGVQRGKVEVMARSSIHDTRTVWSKLAGTIEFDADDPKSARAAIEVDMRVFDAGDRLKNWKIKGDLEPDKHPTATFKLLRFDKIAEVTAGVWEAAAVGQLSWRGQNADVTVKGKATVDRRGIDATATFDLDVRKQLGITPPRFFMFKVEDVVAVQVTLFAPAAPAT